MKELQKIARMRTLRFLFSTLIIVGLVLASLPASPAQPLRTTAQEEPPFPPEGDWYTYANGDDVLALEAQGDVLWAGTRAGGLVRWDTTDDSFVQFLKPQDGLAGNTVRDVYVDGDGNKWLATDYGLSVLDDNGTPDKADDEWYTYTRATTDGQLPSNQVTAVAMDDAGILWIGTRQYWDQEEQAYAGGGVSEVDVQGTLDPSDDEWIHTYTVANTLHASGGNVLLGLASDNVTDILPVPGNRVWIATQKHWAFREFDTAPGQWLLTYGGLSRLTHAGTPETDDDEWKAWTCETGPQWHAGVGCTVHQLKLDQNGYVWAAMRSRGVIAFPYDGGPSAGYARFDRYDGLATNHVETIAFGPAGDPQWQNTVWLGTYDATTGVGRGVCVLNHNGTIRTPDDDDWNPHTASGDCLTAEQGLADDRVQALVAAGGKVWMGLGGRFGMGNGVSGYDLVQQSVEKPLRTADAGLPYNYITDIAVGQEGTDWANGVWFATGHARERRYGAGALRLDLHDLEDPADDTWTQFTHEETDDDGVAPWSGLASDNLTGLAVDGDTLWISTQSTAWDEQTRQWTDGGLSVYDGEDWAIRTEANTGGSFAGLRDDKLSAVAVGCAGNVWAALGNLATNGGLGLNVFDPQGDPLNLSNDVWQQPIKYPTIPSNLVTAIQPDCGRGQLWIATAPHFSGTGMQGGGVGRYDYQSDQWTIWTTRDGIEAYRETGAGDATVRSLAVGPDGTVWAGTWGKSRLSREELINDQPYVPASINWLTGDVWSSRIFENDGWGSSIVVDGYGVVWAGTSRGGLDLDADGLEDDALAGRATGGIKFTLNGTEWLTWTPENSPLVTNDVEVMEVAPDGTVWIGTNGWGIMRFRPSAILGASPTPTPTRTPTTTPTTTSTPTVTLTVTPLPAPTETPRPGTTLYVPLILHDWTSRQP